MRIDSRRWLRFSLRSLLIAVTGMAVWLGWRVVRERERQRLISEIEAVGGHVHIEAPAWLPSFAGERVTSVTIPIAIHANFEMARLNVFPGFEVHRIPGCVMDEGPPCYSNALSQTGNSITYGTHTIEREVELLRQKTSRLTTADLRLVYALEVPAAGNYRWLKRFHLHLAQDRDYWLHSARGMIPNTGLPTQVVQRNQSRIRGPNGPDFMLDVGVEQDPDSDRHVLTARWGPHSTAFLVSPNGSVPDWLSGNGMVGWETVGEEGSEPLKPGAPLELLRLQSHAVSGSNEGILIWIAEDTK